MSKLVEMSFFKMSGLSRLSILTLKSCRDGDSRSRPCQKSRPIETLGHKLCQDLSRQHLWNCWEFLNSRDMVFQMSRLRVSIEIMSSQIETPKLKFFFHLSWPCLYVNSWFFFGVFFWSSFMTLYNKRFFLYDAV